MARRVRHAFFARDDERLAPEMFARKPSDDFEARVDALKPKTVARGRYARAARTATQRVIVKTTVHRGATATNQARYLEKPGAGLDGEAVQAFDARNDALSMKEAVKEWEVDRHHFRIVVSPENGDRMDLTLFTRDLMARTEADLGTKLQWFAVRHYDTAHPHVHILLRGRDDRGADLAIDRRYVRHATRHRARELATMQIGPRTARDMVADMERRRVALELAAERGPVLAKGAGWKLHLNVSSDRNDPVTKAVLKDLRERGLNYDVRFGTRGGITERTLTVPVGSHDRAMQVAQDLDAKFGSRISDQWRNSVPRDDVRLAGNVWGCFDPRGDREFTNWTAKGVPLDRADGVRLLNAPEHVRDAMRSELRDRADMKLMERYGAFYGGMTRAEALERLKELQRDMQLGRGLG